MKTNKSSYPKWLLAKVICFVGLAMLGAPSLAQSGMTSQVVPSYSIGEFIPDGADQHIAVNPEQRFRVAVNGSRLSVVSTEQESPWVLGLELQGYGAAGYLHPVPPGQIQQVSAQRIEYRRGAITEWYENRPEGLEQGFTKCLSKNKWNTLRG